MKDTPDPIKVCVPYGDGDCPEYTVVSSIEGEDTTTAVVSKIKPNKDKPICIETDVAVRYVTVDAFVGDVFLPDKYKQDQEGGSDGTGGEDSGSIYYGPNWKSVREDVIEADGGQCVVCLSEEDLHVHHIKPLRLFDNTETANQPDNLATLCGRCHMRVEVIQDADKRRGVESFIAELESEGVDASEGLLRHLTYNRLTSNPDGSEICPHDGCFYPVMPDYDTCASCGGSLLRGQHHGNAHGNEPASEVFVVKCKDCNLNDVYRQDEPDPGFEDFDWDAEVAAKASRDNHKVSEFRDYSEGKRHRPYIEHTSDDRPCDSCSFNPSSKAQAIDHLVRKHGMGRIEARREVGDVDE